MLNAPHIGDFQVTVLHDAELRAVNRAVRTFFAQAEPDDLLLLHIAGHGMRDHAGSLYFVVKDTESDGLWDTALAASDVRREIRRSKARRVVVLLDCCYSAAFVQDEDEGLPIDLPGEPEPAPPAPPAGSAPGNGDHPRSRGEVVISASTAVQLAFESLFTKCVVHGLATGAADLNHDGEIDSDELYHYVDDRMTRLAHGTRQSPTYSTYRMQGLLRVAHNPFGARRPPPPAPPEPALPEPAPPEPAPPGPHPEIRGPLRRRVLAPLLAVVLLLCGCATRADSAVDDGCPTPAQLRVAVAPAGLTAYREIAAGFEQWVAAQRSGCRSVDLYVFPVAAGDLTEGLRHGWGQGADGRDHLRDVGPHPDVWLPAAETEVPPAGTPGLGGVQQVAQSPIVLGIPERSRADEAQRRAVLPWPELVEAAGPATGVVRADFATSAVARMATAKLYADGTVDRLTARTGVEQPIEKALDAGGYPVGDEADLLCRQRSGAGRAGVVVTEQELVRFNRGDPIDGGCLGAAPPAAGDRLRAFYPADTPSVRQVAVTLTWPKQVQSRNAVAYAGWFVRWLRRDPGREVLLRAGLRPSGFDAGAPIGPAYGALTDWPFARVVQGEPDALTRRDVAALYAAARRPGRFLVALDASGSMNAVTADPTRTRFEVAAAAIEQAATRLGGRDQLGLLSFATGAGRGTRQVLPIAPAGADPSGRMRKATATISPGGDTPLYEAIRRGSAALRAGPGTGDPLRTLVVLTDGKDTTGQARPTGAQTAGVRIFVIAVGDVSCADKALARLATEHAGRCFDGGSGSLEPVLTGLFQAVWDTEES